MDYETVGPEHRDVKDSLLPDMRVRYMHIGGHFFIAYSPDFYELGMCSHFYLSVLTCLVMKRW